MAPPVSQVGDSSSRLVHGQRQPASCHPSEGGCASRWFNSDKNWRGNTATPNMFRCSFLLRRMKLRSVGHPGCALAAFLTEASAASTRLLVASLQTIATLRCSRLARGSNLNSKPILQSVSWALNRREPSELRHCFLQKQHLQPTSMSPCCTNYLTKSKVGMIPSTPRSSCLMLLTPISRWVRLTSNTIFFESRLIV